MDKNSRIKGAIWGQVIGDAITLGSHWIYDPVQLKQQFPDGVKGFDTPKAGHYHSGKVSGDSTHYGEGFKLMLQSIGECKKFDPADFLRRFKAFFGSPFYKGYIDRATRGTLQNMELGKVPTGADDDEMASASRLAPLISLYQDSQELEKKVEEATLMGQNNPKALAYMQCNAKILCDLLHGANLRESFEKRVNDPIVGERVRFALSEKNLSSAFEATRKFGPTCHLDEAFPSSIYISLLYENAFDKALLANAEASGDSAGRGAMMGAWLGALLGFEAIPPQWILQIRGKELIGYWIDELISAIK